MQKLGEVHRASRPPAAGHTTTKVLSIRPVLSSLIFAIITLNPLNSYSLRGKDYNPSTQELRFNEITYNSNQSSNS